MRKIFWAGAAAVVAGAVGVYFGASSVSSNPNGWLGRWVSGGHTGSRTVGQLATTVPQVFTLGEQESHRKDGGLQCEVPELFSADLARLPASTSTASTDPIQVPLPELSTAGESKPGSEIGQDAKAGELTEFPGAPAYPIQDCTKTPAAMPPLLEDQIDVIPVSEETKALEMSLQVVQELLHACFGSDSAATAGEEAQEIKEPKEALPPGTPDADADMLPTRGPNDPPDCREDPHYHKHYPGCPYTGRGCPYDGHYYPRAYVPSFEKPKPEEVGPPAPETKVKPPKAQLMKSKKKTTKEGGAGKGTIDTMDMRPTDLDRWPFDDFPF